MVLNRIPPSVRDLKLKLGTAGLGEREKKSSEVEKKPSADSIKTRQGFPNLRSEVRGVIFDLRSSTGIC